MNRNVVPRWQVLLILPAVGVFAIAQASPSTTNPSSGKQYFAANCAACHTTTRGTNGIGPSLAGVFGRRSGTAPGFTYSTELKSANIIWNGQSLDSWLRRPTNDVHTTRMLISVPNATDRQNVIAYLRTL